MFESARHFVRNPLGIIGLFVTLSYAIAGAVSGFSKDGLPVVLMWMLIIFIVAFPILVLLVFVWLVVRHHDKLYGPKDFDDPEGFIKAMTAKQKLEKLNAEVAEIVSDSASGAQEAEAQEMGEAVEVANALARDPRASYMLAEMLVFRKLEEEYGTEVQTSVEVRGGGAPDQYYDGVIIHRREIIVVEVKYLRRPHLRPAAMDKLLGSAMAASQQYARGAFSGLKPRILLALVAEPDLSEMPRLMDRLTERANQSPIPFDVRLFNLGDLKREFGVS